MITRPIRTEAEYKAALVEIERYFAHEPKKGTAEADRFDLLALLIGSYEDQHHPIGAAHELPRDERRSRVHVQRAVRIERPDDVEIGLERARRILRMPDACDAVLVFAHFLCPRMPEVVACDTGVGVEIKVWLLFGGDTAQQPGKQRVLEDVGEVAGVENVTVRKHVWNNIRLMPKRRL